jgi:hypothetical protein
MPTHRSFAFICIAVSLLQFVAATTAEGLDINVHLLFAPPLLTAVTAVNAKFENETIRFPQPHTPHVTLYLSKFPESALPGLINAIREAAKAPAFAMPCESKISYVFASGSYIMLPISESTCLQSMSDVVVQHTHHMSIPNQTAPAWLLLLPEPQRSMKMDMLIRFGSPNVFRQYEPHITIACSASATELALATRALDGKSLAFIPHQLRVSKSGSCGTVANDQTLLSIDLLSPSNSSGNITCASFNVVSLQTGSSSSCSGGNTHVWPLLPEGQCHGWSAVDTSGKEHKNSANNIQCNPDKSFSFMQFAGSLDCTGNGHLKTFYAGQCKQVPTLMAALFISCWLIYSVCLFSLFLFIMLPLFVILYSMHNTSRCD